MYTGNKARRWRQVRLHTLDKRNVKVFNTFQEKSYTFGHTARKLYTLSRLLDVLLSLVLELLSLLHLRRQDLLDLIDSTHHKALGLLAVLLANLLQLLEGAANVGAAGDHVEKLLNATAAAAASALGCLADLLLDELGEVVGVARLASLLQLLPQLAEVTLEKLLLVALDELLELRALVEDGLGLLDALLPSLVAVLLDLLALVLHKLLDLAERVHAEAGLEDVLDLVPGLVDLLLGLGAVLLAHLLELAVLATDLLLQLRVVLDDVLESVTSELANADEGGGDDLPCLGSGLGGEAGLCDVLQLVVGLLNNLVDLALVPGANLLEVIKGTVNVCGGARDVSGVAGDGLLEPLDGLARLGSVLCGLCERIVGGGLCGVDAVDDTAGAREVVETESDEESGGATGETTEESTVAATLLCGLGGLEADVLALVEADGLTELESSGRPEGRSGGGGKHDCDGCCGGV